jgi:glycosyltransferase involved in cell wall biosynthesis
MPVPEAERLSPAVSVFVPSYNHERFVEACLRSIFAQTYQPNLLLVIDDGSSDDSVHIIDRVLEDCPCPTEFIVRANRGLGATLNEALSRSSGPLITYLASDDTWEPDRLKESVRVLSANLRAAATFGECFLIDEQASILNSASFASLEGRRRLPGFRPPRPPVVDLDGLFSFRTVPLTPTVTYRRAAVERFGWNESSRTEDYEMYMLVASIGDFVHVSRALGSWRLHPGNTSRDLDAMLYTALAVQRRVAERIGVPERALRRYRACVRYGYGEYFLRAGRWRRGTALTMRNMAGAPRSTSAIIERVARIVISPKAVAALRSAGTPRFRGPRVVPRDI